MEGMDGRLIGVEAHNGLVIISFIYSLQDRIIGGLPKVIVPGCWVSIRLVLRPFVP